MNPQVEQVKALLRQLKVESYEENVIPFLIEFMDRMLNEFGIKIRVKEKGIGGSQNIC